MSTITPTFPKPLRITATVLRYLLGLIFFVFGLNGFFQFLPNFELQGTALAYMQGLMAAAYFFPLLKGLEVVAGLFLLTNRYVPLGIAILGPITLQIFLFHTFLTPPNPVAFLVFFGNIFLAVAYKEHFQGIFQK
ncbi:MAG: DoxX family protein [Bacteroidota bacterium]